MYVISNAFMSQAEIVQKNRWDFGPLEIVFLDNFSPGWKNVKQALGILKWNQTFRAGFVRPSDAFEVVEEVLPNFIECSSNPNVFFAPRQNGYTELHAMLTSVIPAATLRRHKIRKRKANFWLCTPAMQFSRFYAKAAEQAFAHFIWSKIAQKERLMMSAFASDSSLRLLTSDIPFWMSRLYRIAIERRERIGEISRQAKLGRGGFHVNG